MSFEPEARVLVAMAALAAGCTGSVHDESLPSGPLLIIRGHVDLASLTRTHPGAQLLGALGWAAPAAVNPVCIEFDALKTNAACPDPYGVFWGQLERAAPVAADGSFALELYGLPKASVSVGDEITRIAYGSLIVVEDVNGDGQPSLPAPAGDRGGRHGRGEEEAPVPVPNPDVVVAASFYTLRADQRRIVFREGGFVEGSNFYPAPGCNAPPGGFSVLTAPPYSDEKPARGGCTVQDIGGTIEVVPLSLEEAVKFECRPAQRGTTVRQPEADEPPAPGTTSICLSREILASVAPGLCPRLTAYALKGCRTDPLCEKPEWDQTAAKPSWWPCL